MHSPRGMRPTPRFTHSRTRPSVTGKPIAKERLEAVPHTEISIEAKRKEKAAGDAE